MRSLRMAAATRVRIRPSRRPVFGVDHLTQASADRASDLLQQNHDAHHIFFNHDGFHNHIAHHLLAVYALGATPSQLTDAYERGKAYQRPLQPVKGSVGEKLRKGDFAAFLGKEQYYHDFLTYFEAGIAENGLEKVLQSHLFSGEPDADDLLSRTFAGFYHPLIHLGYGIEFSSGAIVAEALAQAAVHNGDYLKPFLTGAEKMAAGAKPGGSKSLVQLLDEIHADETVRNGPHWEDGNKLKGLLQRALESMIQYASQYSVTPGQLSEANAEMVNAAAYFSGAAQRPDKVVKFDFFYMHCMNSSIFFSSFMKQSWLSEATKIRLLEWKCRADLGLYASRKSPKLYIREIVDYEPLEPAAAGEDAWAKVFDTANQVKDDGHLAKLIRAFAHGREVSAPYGNHPEFRITPELWLQLAYMGLDSTERTGDPRWVRSTGFDEAWEQVRNR